MTAHRYRQREDWFVDQEFYVYPRATWWEAHRRLIAAALTVLSILAFWIVLYFALFAVGGPQ